RRELRHQHAHLRVGQGCYLAAGEGLDLVGRQRAHFVAREGRNVLGGDRLQLRRGEGRHRDGRETRSLRGAQGGDLTRGDVGTEGVDLVRREDRDFLRGDRLHLGGAQAADDRRRQTRSLGGRQRT